MRSIMAMVSAATITGMCGLAAGQTGQPSSPAPQLSPQDAAKRLDELEKQVRELKALLESQRAAQQAQPAAPATPATPPPTPPPAPPPPAGHPAAAAPPAQQAGAATETEARLNEHDQKLEELDNQVKGLTLGSQKFHLGGFIEGSFTAPEHGNSMFGAAIKPIFLWKLSEQLYAAGAVEFEIEDNDSKANIEYGYVGYNVTDYLSLRAGVLLHPLDTFQQSLHPSWINLLPDAPMFADDGGLAPEKGTGVEARGAFQTKVGKFNYTAWATNGPSLNETGDGAGTYNLDEFSDINSNKAFGARVGYLPIPSVEVYYGFQFNDVIASDSTLPSNYVAMHDFGVSYVTEASWATGRIDARAEFLFADMDKKIDLGSGPFNNDRSGGYVQLGYRPTQAGCFLKDFEPIVRWDFLHAPNGAPDPSDRQRWTVGLDYWVSPRAVAKVAYEFDDVSDPSGNARSNNAFLAQVVIGF